MADVAIPAVAAKNLALSNTTALDVVAFEKEITAILAMKAAAPNRSDLSILNARHAAINTHLKNHA